MTNLALYLEFTSRTVLRSRSPVAETLIWERVFIKMTDYRYKVNSSLSLADLGFDYLH